MLKIKLVGNLFCPTPFCDQCGKEIEGATLGDPGAYVYVSRVSECHEGHVFDMFFVHKNYAKNGSRCMDRWEAQHANRDDLAPDAPMMGWLDLDELVKTMPNNPGFTSR